MTNNGESAVNGWDVTWEYVNGSTITNSWNVSLGGTNPYTGSSLEWNSNIALGQTLEFGFQGVNGSNGSAEVPAVTGDICE